MEGKNDSIDFVIIWVDENDINWQNEKNIYDKTKKASDVRYRDWDTLRFWFRCVEKNAAWVRKIHFVTCGHVPSWLNTGHPKLNFVRHDEFMKSEYLPTFSSHPIELNLHRIKGLSEKFVYFNDDMFINKEVFPRDFFIDNMPCDSAILSPIKIERNGIANIVVNDIEIINDHFNIRESIRNGVNKWFNIRYGVQMLRTMILLPCTSYPGFYETHIPNSYLKSTYKEIWKKEYEILDKTCLHKFRDKKDVNQWLMRYWQLASGKFIPRKVNSGKMFMVDTSLDEIVNEIHRHRLKMICINDSEKLKNFVEAKKRIKEAFRIEYPEKSQFEL